MQRRELSVFALALLMTGAIDSMRNLPASAWFGGSLIFFFVLAAIFFLIPTGLVSAMLASKIDLAPGIYGWVRAAFGPRLAVLAVWLQWINVLVWYPAILSFIAGTVAYLIDPALAQNRYYLIACILAIFWGMTWINLRGIHVSARVASICAVAGMIIPMFLIIFLSAVWLLFGRPVQIDFSWHALWPSVTDSQSWISLTAMMSAFLGVELSAVYVKDVRHPQKSFPKALLFAVIFILSTMILGSLAIAIVIPRSHIGLVDGVMEAFQYFLNAYHLRMLEPLMAILLVVGSVGGLVNWMLAPMRGLAQAGADGYLPATFWRPNARGVASRLLLLQAGIVSVVCLVFLCLPSVNGSYWLLTALSTNLYMLMYVLLFGCAWVLQKKYAGAGGFDIPGGRFGLMVTCILGVLGCTATLLVGFFSPAGINVGNVCRYEWLFCGGLMVMIVPVFGLYAYARRRESVVFARSYSNG